MNHDQVEKRLKDILPDRPLSFDPSAKRQEVAIAENAEKIVAKQNAQELARLKYKERQKLKHQQDKLEKKKALAEKLGVEITSDAQTEHQMRSIKAQQEKVELIEAIEARTVQPLHPVELAEMVPMNKTYSSTVTKALQMQGASRPEVLKLLASLNINLNVQLSKSDTANLLACLLTCNEAQLSALYNNKKIPIVIKTVIKRLQEDARLGNIETVEKLWDRVFGKNAMSLNLPEQAQIETGIIPNTPVSREAYIVIRDTLIK